MYNLFVWLILGTLIVLFFQCMVALFNPINQRSAGVKWGLVSYTVTMFSIATVLTGMALNLESISHIDNREYPGIEGEFFPGPIGYQLSIWSGVLVIPPRLMFLLNNWLSDGLLVSSILTHVMCSVGSSNASNAVLSSSFTDAT